MSGRVHEAGAHFESLVPSIDEQGRAVRVSILTRTGCHLCKRAQAVVDKVLEPLAVASCAIDIDAQDPQARADLLARYGEWLPVIFVDGRVHDYWTVDPARLQETLAGT